MVVIYPLDQLVRETVLFHPSLNPFSLLIMHRLVDMQLAEIVCCLSEDEGEINPGAEHGEESEQLFSQCVRDNITIHDGSHRARA